jgi:2-dehydropantoate 2-reductase
MKIGIFGAGSIGCYMGGMLAAAGMHPVLVGRTSMMERLARGMKLTSHDGDECIAEPDTFVFSTSPDPLAKCDAVLVCVKSSATTEAGKLLARALLPEARVVSLQNGISNPDVLREALAHQHVLAGMVGFNVAQIGADRFHRGTEGHIVIQDGAGTSELVEALNAGGIPAAASAYIQEVQWGKLILNLNNSVNALSGLPLKRQLAQRAYRHVTAMAVREALAAMKAAKIRPARITSLPPWILPFVLDLPDGFFVRLARGMFRIDDNARSSMAEDLERGRQPEIDWLNGEIVQLGQRNNVATPVNEKLVSLVKAASERSEPPAMSGQQLLAAVGIS